MIGCCRDSLPSMGWEVGGANVAVLGCCGDSLPSMSDGVIMNGIEFEGVTDVAFFLVVGVADQGCCRDSLPGMPKFRWTVWWGSLCPAPPPGQND